jgi:hypothetical protein
MLDKDLLLLEVRLRPEPSADPVPHLTRVAWPASHRFDYGPLELLGVPYDEDLLTYKLELDRGTIRGTDTIVARYAQARVDGRHFDEIDLSYVHRYNEEALLAATTRAGFKVRRTWKTPRGSNLWLLLQK